MPNQFLFANFFATELTSSVGVGDTVLNIPPSAAALLQNFSSGFYLTLSLWDGVNPPEIVWVTNSPQTGALTVLRAQEGTSAFGWSAGTQVRSALTAAVINAALAAYNAGQVLLANYLPLGGGTLTGPLTLSGAPTVALHAATKAYVDALGGGPFLALAGGTLTGNLSFSNNARLTGLLTPSVGTEPATKTYADAITTSLNDLMADRSGVLTTAGTAAAYTVATNQGYSGGLTDGVRLAFRVHATNQITPTLAVDGTAPVILRAQAGVSLPPGRLVVGSVWEVEYRAATPEWILVGERQQNFIPTTGGTTAYALTSGYGITTLQDGLEVGLSLNLANTGACTLNVDTIGAIPLRPASGIEYGAGALPQYSLVRARYNSTTGEWLTIGAPGLSAPTQNLGFADITNLQLSASVNTNILTVAVKNNVGVDPTPASPINIAFPDSTVANGDPVWRQITAALSINTLGVGASLGSVNATPFRLWVVAFDNGGTVVLGLINCSTTTQIFPLNEVAVQSTTQMSAGSTSAGVFYTPNGTVLAGKSFRILGYVEYNAGLVTAGTYNIAPTAVRLFGHGVKKPGDSIQRVTGTSAASTAISATSAGAATAVNPSVVITPTSTINLIKVRCSASIQTGNGTATTMQVQLARNSVANYFGNIAHAIQSNTGAITGSIGAPVSLDGLDAPGSVSSLTYQPYAFRGTANGTWNQGLGAYIEAEELMA